MWLITLYNYNLLSDKLSYMLAMGGFCSLWIIPSFFFSKCFSFVQWLWEMGFNFKTRPTSDFSGKHSNNKNEKKKSSLKKQTHSSKGQLEGRFSRWRETCCNPKFARNIFLSTSGVETHRHHTHTHVHARARIHTRVNSADSSFNSTWESSLDQRVNHGVDQCLKRAQLEGRLRITWRDSKPEPCSRTVLTPLPSQAADQLNVQNVEWFLVGTGVWQNTPRLRVM